MNGGISQLTVFYDPACAVCSGFRDWLENQVLWVSVRFLGYDELEAEKVMPELRTLEADKECVVLADDGRWWQGAEAWLTCLWATREYRLWASRLAAPMFRPVLLKVVDLISKNRFKLSRMMGRLSDRELVAELNEHEVKCADEACPWPEWRGALQKGGAQ